MKKRQPSREGFTLVEIMIVVAIIGMLASIAIPNYINARAKANTVACISNLKLIDGAVQQWALELKRDEKQAVTYRDIRSYLRNPVICPAGETSFDDSYALTTVDQRPVCLRRPDAHQMPE
jgi:prepilin-type N-terminal cleavage/methylation domain-containing protein